MKPIPVPFKTIPRLMELKNAFPGLKALFFDMDGTLFNTESYHADALFKMASTYDIKSPYSVEQMHEMMVGKADHFLFEIIKDWEGVPRHWTHELFVEEKNRNLIEILSAANPADYFPTETLNLLHEAKAAGLYLGLVTSSEKVVTDELLKIANVKEIFNLILTRNDCPSHKPDPWPYLKAMDVAGHDKSCTVIFEDSPVGLSAAVSSGAHVIKVEWF